MDLATAARDVNGEVRGGNRPFLRVVSDTRALQPDDLFVALSGERFDGHDFVGQAMEAGAAGAIVNDARAPSLAGNLIVVDDPLRALGRLAAAWRARFTLPLALVVGSNGKTTVKEMTAAALSVHFGADAVLATQGNLNNAIGLPLTLLRLRDSHLASVIELGMNHRGETAELAPMAAPTIVVVNNAQREHQEFMRSVAEVAAEHADAILALPRYGAAVINADDTHADVWRDAALRAGAKIVAFGTRSDADVRADITLRDDGSTLLLSTPDGAAKVVLAVPGRAMAQNALAAAAAALSAGAGLDAIVKGLSGFAPIAGRLARRTAASGALVIDDSYNANPDSVRAAIDVLARARGDRWLVLGDMGEVGDGGPAFHREAGEYARSAGIDRLFTTGELAKATAAAYGPGAQHFDDVSLLGDCLAREAHAGVTVLVKGSRFMRMERVVTALSGAAAEKR